MKARNIRMMNKWSHTKIIPVSIAKNASRSSDAKSMTCTWTKPTSTRRCAWRSGEKQHCRRDKMVTLRIAVYHAKKSYVCDMHRHHTIFPGEPYIYMFGNATDEPMYPLRFCKKCVKDYDYCNSKDFNAKRDKLLKMEA
jgi:hypothetical protein